jgi:hypothetical protein
LTALLAVAWLAISPPAQSQDASDPKAVELSAQLFELAGVRPMMNQMLDQLAPSMTQLIQQANPGKEAEVDEVMNRFIVPKMKARLPEVINEGAKVYAKHFSADELAQLIQFYQSPLGEKLVHEQPLIAKEMATVSTAWAQAVAVQAVHEYADEFKKRGLETPI